MQLLDTEKMIFTDARHMLIVKAYVEKIGLVETIDRMVSTKMELNSGLAVLVMVLDTLSGRTPLYRLTEFFEEKVTELLLGVAVEPEHFCDYKDKRPDLKQFIMRPLPTAMHRTSNCHRRQFEKD